MNIHLIAEGDSDHVLSRLARALADGGGYGLSPTPDPRADLNYFFPYIWYSQRFADFRATATAAYFSHHDTQDATKHDWWERAAGAVGLRMVTARRYGHEVKGYGLTAYAHAPVDSQFTPGPPRSLSHRPVVGVSGFVYGDNRKGEKLLGRLVGSALGQRLDWTAAGQGWPIARMRLLGWGELPDFYRALDVYVCTALVEGVPLPPLEAMACGVRCVVPAGVGMLDELPPLPDLYRYEAGNLASLSAALERAAFDRRPVDAAALREAVRDYTARQWVVDHQEAFARLLQPPFPVEKLLPWRGNAGAFYVAYGEPARGCAVNAMRAWRRFMPDVPAAVVSDRPAGLELANGDVFVEHPDSDIGARWVKINIDLLAPQNWTYILYMDADTELVADVGFLFDALADGWELVICKNPGKYHTFLRAGRPDNQEELAVTAALLGDGDVLQWNGGVFGFRRSARTAAFFQRWREEWQRWGSRDQAALLRAMWRGPLRVYTLGNEWNTVTHYDPPESSAGILHYPQRARRYQGIIHGRLDSPQAWEKVKR